MRTRHRENVGAPCRGETCLAHFRHSRGGRHTCRPYGTKSRRGFFEIDVLAGLVIVAALTVALAAVLGRQHRAVQKMADARAAAQVAEAVLTGLQSGKPAPTAQPDPDVVLKIGPLQTSDTARGSDAWVEVVVTVRAGRASLVGLVPGSASPTAPTAP